MLNPEALRRNLIGISNRGVIELVDGAYRYDSGVFESRLTERARRDIEGARKNINRYSVRLLHQCSSCGRIYVKDRKTCICGGEVKSVERGVVIKPLLKRIDAAQRDTQKIRVKELTMRD